MRQNPHVRICGGPGSATTLVYPTVLGCRFKAVSSAAEVQEKGRTLSLESPARELTVRNRRLLVLVLGCRLGRLRYVLCIHRERVEHLVPALLRPDHVALRRRVVPVRG